MPLQSYKQVGTIGLSCMTTIESCYADDCLVQIIDLRVKADLGILLLVVTLQIELAIWTLSLNGQLLSVVVLVLVLSDDCH